MKEAFNQYDSFERMETIMKLRLLVGLTAFALLAAACAPVPAQELAGTSWVLQSLNGDGAVGEAIGGKPVTLNFADASQVNGSSGCNNYSGSYESDTRDGSLLFSPLASTLMACEETVMAVEHSFFVALQESSSYTISGDTLTIDSNSSTLVFVRQ